MQIAVKVKERRPSFAWGWVVVACVLVALCTVVLPWQTRSIEIAMGIVVVLLLGLAALHDRSR
jgi:hypothetical protein